VYLERIVVEARKVLAHMLGLVINGGVVVARDDGHVAISALERKGKAGYASRQKATARSPPRVQGFTYVMYELPVLVTPIAWLYCVCNLACYGAKICGRIAVAIREQIYDPTDRRFAQMRLGLSLIVTIVLLQLLHVQKLANPPIQHKWHQLVMKWGSGVHRHAGAGVYRDRVECSEVIDVSSSAAAVEEATV
jgi:hypothetical protein